MIQRYIVYNDNGILFGYESQGDASLVVRRSGFETHLIPPDLSEATWQDILSNPNSYKVLTNSDGSITINSTQGDSNGVQPPQPDVTSNQ